MSEKMQEDEILEDDVEQFEESRGENKGVTYLKNLSNRPMLWRVLLLLVAIAVGGYVKSVAASRITMGFQDYTVEGKQVYDLDAAEQRLASQAQADGGAPSVGIPTGGSCGGF